jgi:hypothetical protein
MTINIHADDPECTPELKAYAEYRVFASLGRYAGRVSAVNVRLRQTKPSQHRYRWQCSVSASISACEPRSIRAVGRFAVQSVDRAIERLTSAVEHAIFSEVARVQ